MATANYHIKDFLEYYIGLDEPQYAILLSGKWGSGKSHFIEQFKSEHPNIRVIKISLFGLKFKEDIHKKIVLEQFTFPKTSEAIAKNLNNVLEKFTGVNLNLALSDISVESAIKQVGKKKTLFVFDDLERIEMSFPEAFGYINQLVEDYGQKVIFLADETQLKNREEYQQFKEKIIGKTFQIEQDFDTAFFSFLKEMKNAKEIVEKNLSTIKSVYEAAGYNNLRSLRQGLLDFDRLINNFEPKFKNHTELMTEIIQIFFALTFEVKSGKLDILTLQNITMLRVSRMMNDNESNNEPTPIEEIYKKYSFLSHELLLSAQNWIELFTLGILTSEQISKDLINSPYFFREKREEWLNLWYFRELEEDEFQKALEDTLKKLEGNEYLTPEIVMHISGILLSLSANGLYSKHKIDIVNDMKTYIDKNRKKWDNIYTVDDFNIDNSAFGLGYHYGETDEFKEIKTYLLEKAQETIYEDLPSQGEKLLNNLKDNNIDAFQDMLLENRDRILYRLPVFKVVDPKHFIDTLKCVKNRNFRKLINILILRYEKIGWEAYSPLLEELDFWKKVCEANNIQNVSVDLKILWLKQLNKSIEEEIIQKIEKQLQ